MPGWIANLSTNPISSPVKIYQISDHIHYNHIRPNHTSLTVIASYQILMHFRLPHMLFHLPGMLSARPVPFRLKRTNLNASCSERLSLKTLIGSKPCLYSLYLHLLLHSCFNLCNSRITFSLFMLILLFLKLHKRRKNIPLYSYSPEHRKQTQCFLLPFMYFFRSFFPVPSTQGQMFSYFRENHKVL